MCFPGLCRVHGGHSVRAALALATAPVWRAVTTTPHRAACAISFWSASPTGDRGMRSRYLV